MNANRLKIYTVALAAFSLLSLGVGAVAYIFFHGTSTFVLLIALTNSKAAAMLLFGASTLLATWATYHLHGKHIFGKGSIKA